MAGTRPGGSRDSRRKETGEKDKETEKLQAELKEVKEEKDKLCEKLEQTKKSWEDCHLKRHALAKQLAESKGRVQKLVDERNDFMQNGVNSLVYDEEKEVNRTNCNLSQEDRKRRLVAILSQSTKSVARKVARMVFDKGIRFMDAEEMRRTGIILQIFDDDEQSSMAERVRLVEPLKVYVGQRFSEMKRLTKNKFCDAFLSKNWREGIPCCSQLPPVCDTNNFFLCLGFIIVNGRNSKVSEPLVKRRVCLPPGASNETQANY